MDQAGALMQPQWRKFLPQSWAFGRSASVLVNRWLGRERFAVLPESFGSTENRPGGIPAVKEFQMFNLQKTRGALRNASAALVGLGLSAVAMAQTADPFATAVTDATAKIGTYGGALVGLSAVGVIFMIAMKYVKRIPRAA